MKTDWRQSGQHWAMKIEARLGANVRRLRQKTGLSQEAFADLADIHRTYISDVERGRRNPTISVVEKLAMALKVHAGALLDDPAEDPPHDKCQ